MSTFTEEKLCPSCARFRWDNLAKHGDHVMIFLMIGRVIYYIIQLSSKEISNPHTWAPTAPKWVLKYSYLSIGMGIFRLLMKGKFNAYLLWPLRNNVKFNKCRALLIQNSKDSITNFTFFVNWKYWFLTSNF